MSVKKTVLSVFVAAALISLTACAAQGTADSSGVPQRQSNSAVVERQSVASPAGSTASASSAASSSANFTSQVSIEGDYSYENEYNAYHILVVKNNSDATLKITSNSTAHDAAGNLIGASESSVRAVGPGCTSYIREAFSKVSGVNSYETKLNASEDKSAPVLQDLELSATPTGKNVVLQCANNGGENAEFVQALVLFFSGDTLVDSTEKYFSSNTEPLAPGESKSEQVSSSETFDSVSAYLSGQGK